jgi:hypothetical protein
VHTVLLTINNVSAGQTTKSIDLPIGRVHYLESRHTRYEAETVVLLHGITLVRQSRMKTSGMQLTALSTHLH